MKKALQNEMIWDFIKKVYGSDEEKWAAKWEDPMRKLGLVTMIWETVTRLYDEDVAALVDGIEYDPDNGFGVTTKEALIDMAKMLWCESSRVKVDLAATANLLYAVEQQMEFETGKDD